MYCIRILFVTWSCTARTVVSVQLPQPCSLVDMSVLFNAHCAAVAPSKVQTVQGRKYLGQRCIYRRHEDELFNNTAHHFSVYIISKKSVIALYIHVLHFD